MDKLEVLYNDQCPICSREIAHYKRIAGQDVAFDPISDKTPESWGISEDEAARELRVRVDGQVLTGVDAFLALWARLPVFRVLARVVRLWPLRSVAAVIYKRIAVPVLYRMHLRRMRG